VKLTKETLATKPPFVPNLTKTRHALLFTSNYLQLISIKRSINNRIASIDQNKPTFDKLTRMIDISSHSMK